MLLALDDKYFYQFKVCLRSTVKLCRAQPSHCPIFVDAISSTMMNISSENKHCDLQAVVLCEALGAIGSVTENILLPLLPDILMKMQQTFHVDTKVSTNKIKAKQNKNTETCFAIKSKINFCFFVFLGDALYFVVPNHSRRLRMEQRMHQCGEKCRDKCGRLGKIQNSKKRRTIRSPRNCNLYFQKTQRVSGV